MNRNAPREIQVEQHTVEIDGAKLFAKAWTPPRLAKEEPILLFHDSIGCTALWRAFPERLAKDTGRQVVAYDRLGFGESDPPPNGIKFTFVSDEARTVIPELLERLEITNFVACGHSVGGAMAIETASSLGRRLTAAITIAAQAFVEARTLEGIAPG
ncbi:alpha/beta fold hydrolase [Rhizobium sp. BK060]|uniref:alpha/beta fold hydrolase n=1 Tax=Rhizobium sp. BK060 TaxID=2587096 RepID=UPI0017B72EE3|nr:alpha/beta fold hydrolase [Rhizobium sp. BK060]MBB3398789.1 pimeloyl-ACP methyl ester carboxylesterase [Rhizobium sp. BK060]